MKHFRPLAVMLMSALLAAGTAASVRLQGAVSRNRFLQVLSETSSRPSRPIRAAFQFMHAAHAAMTAISS